REKELTCGGVSEMHKTDDLSGGIRVLQLYVSIVLSADSLCICQKRNQMLKNGTHHESDFQDDS
ncbi:hypothetical protein AH312_27555, partial [Salmonella enterica subsp. enterica]|nr:hypothetical protein [Salmonella enterica subsp. enterica serovar Soumbedioune]